MSQQSIQNKQKYLRDKILEKGHDAQAFMAYCETNYGHIDLEGWPLAKLKEIVKNYLGDKAQQTFTQQQLENQEWHEYQQPQESVPQVQAHNYQKTDKKSQLIFSDADWGIFGLQTHQNQSISMKQQPTQKLAFNNLGMNPKSTQSITPPSSYGITKTTDVVQFANNQDKPINQKSFNKKSSLPKENKQFEQLKVDDINQVMPTNKIIQVGTIEIPIIKGKFIQQFPNIQDIKILKTQQKNKNFLQGDYTLYHIQFCPGNHIIQKKFNDLRKLRIILQKIYPHIRLPYLEPEGWLVNSSQTKHPQTLQRYKHMVIQFLKYATMRNQLLKKSKIVRIFTGYAQGNQAEFKKYQNILKPKLFAQMCLPEGKFHFPKYQNISPVDKYMNNMQNLIVNVDTCYEKLKRSMETLFYNYQAVSKSLVEVSGIFQTLQEVIQKFNFENDVEKDLRVFEGLKQMCNKMKEEIDDQNAIFKTKIQTLFKYERDNMTTIKDVNQIRSKMFYEFAKQNLQSKKSSEFLGKGETTVEGTFSIQQPIKNNKNLLIIQNMFWSYHSMQNAFDYWAELRYKINEQLTMVAYQQLDAQNKNLNFWNVVIKKCVL